MLKNYNLINLKNPLGVDISIIENLLFPKRGWEYYHTTEGIDIVCAYWENNGHATKFLIYTDVVPDSDLPIGYTHIRSGAGSSSTQDKKNEYKSLKKWIPNNRYIINHKVETQKELVKGDFVVISIPLELWEQIEEELEEKFGRIKGEIK